MILAAAFCPNPPVLIPEVAQGAAGELADLRAACRTAITRIASPDRRLVILGGGLQWGDFGPSARGSFAGFGVPLEVGFGDRSGPDGLPLSLAVGAWLVEDALGPQSSAQAYTVTDDVPDVGDGDIALVVMGDGSARRGRSAPGYLDACAAPFDAGVVAALGSGDPGALRDLDAGLGAELLASGVPAWQAAGALLNPDGYTAELLYADAPFGVGYFVAVWT